jgi:hypothetical protein
LELTLEPVRKLVLPINARRSALLIGFAIKAGVQAEALVAAIEFNGGTMATKQLREGDRNVEEAALIVSLAKPNRKAVGLRAEGRTQ